MVRNRVGDPFGHADDSAVLGCEVNRNYIRRVVRDRWILLSQRDSMEKDHADV